MSYSTRFRILEQGGLIIKPEERNSRITRCLTFYSRPHLCKHMDRTNLPKLEEISVAARRGVLRTIASSRFLRGKGCWNTSGKCGSKSRKLTVTVSRDAPLCYCQTQSSREGRPWVCHSTDGRRLYYLGKRCKEEKEWRPLHKMKQKSENEV